MNELNLFSDETTEKMATTKELAEMLGVDVRTIQRAALKLFDPSTIMSQVINGGKMLGIGQNNDFRTQSQAGFFILSRRLYFFVLILLLRNYSG